MRRPEISSSKTDVTELLRATPFGTLGDVAFASVTSLFVRRRVARGAPVFLEGDAGDRFFLAPAGAVPHAGAEVTLPFTQAEFAQVLNITPENLSRALSRLRRDGALERLGRGRFRIADVAALAELAEPSA